MIIKSSNSGNTLDFAFIGSLVFIIEEKLKPKFYHIDYHGNTTNIHQPQKHLNPKFLMAHVATVLDYCHPHEDGYQNIQMHSMAVQSQYTKLHLIFNLFRNVLKF